MKDEIKSISLELLLRHGFQGFRFRDVAEMLNTTRANIHHHYGNKLNLCEEVIVDYVAETLANWETNWRSGKSFADKIEAMMESNRQRYLRCNPTGKTANPWSLIGRMRLEGDVIGPRASAALADFGVRLDNLIKAGIDQAIAAGELSKEIPRDDIALQLVAIANSAGPITQDGGNFDRLQQLYRSFNRIVHHAYGTRLKS
ncbi:MAG TPA: TetR/AcrR family transcriptional regulator [Bosea sp. (in: a-proteobacteria)]|jgi:AcrR family transcriptional regulator|uniref:TetR/AcrR family transcriptional regulator n=1 Tax=Bosea sp. (in: a-proteobacteria) TaxID=1871050 RepID=UPI002DDD6C33|nr:TetR/AcrR family transcriptional regulator [Bosea sp. (in: a-proteobacteria)]HEV2555649.1 TetR/AcrR family transcriptional regulator [Bosea sp. (in: a-proteobacteria)]